MFEQTQRWWDKKKSIFFVVYSFLFVVAFVGAPLISPYEVSALSLTPTIHSVPTFGNWSDSGTWVEGRVPTSDDIVEIDGDISLYGGATIGGLIVNGRLSGGYGILTIGNSGSIGGIENFGTIFGIPKVVLNSGDFINTGAWSRLLPRRK